MGQRVDPASCDGAGRRQLARQGVILQAARAVRIPTLSLIFGYGAMLPLAAAAVAAWLVTDPWRGLLLRLGVVWAAAVLAFLGGVRRGSSFYTAGSPRLAQILTMLWLFTLAFVALLSGSNGAAIALLTIGYASVAILDPIAARRGEAPAHFARLRPPQMAVAIISLLLMATVVVRS